MQLSRHDIETTIRGELDAHAGQCRPEHAELASRIARALEQHERQEAPQAGADEPLDLGLWIDDAPSLVLTTAYLDRLCALPLSHVAVMVERSGGGLHLTWSGAQLSKLSNALCTHERVLTLWPEPTQAYLARLQLVLPGLLRAIGRSPRGCFVLEFDLEGHWQAPKVSGFASLKAAGAALVRVVHEVGAELGAEIEIEVTTFPSHLEASERGAVLGEERLLLQTYPVAEARGETRAFDGPLGPERRPFEDVLRVRAHAERDVELCAGLAAWEQANWPGEPEQAMALALESARRAGVRRVRWWSARHAIGASANRYAARAIEAARPMSLRARAR